MTKKQSALDAVETAIAAIDDEISEHVAGRGRVSSLLQLDAFHADLEAMKRQLLSDTVPPRDHRLTGMGRVIADSWPFDSPLGASLLRAEQQYLSV